MEEVTTAGAEATAGEGVSTQPAAPAESAETFEPANYFGFGPDDVSGQQETKEEAAQAGDGEPAPAKQTGEAEESTDGVADQLAGKAQAEIGTAFKNERKRAEEKYKREYEEKLEADPARVRGMRMIQDVMDREGLSYDDAVKAIDERWYEAIAKRDNTSPHVIRELDRMKHPAKTKTPEVKEEAAEDTTAWANKVVSEIMEMDNQPEGFELRDAIKDAAFLELLQQYPPQAAVRVYQAERRAAQAPQDVAEKLRARKSLPQSERAQKAVSPTVDYGTMSDSDFLEMKAKIAKSNR